MFRQFLIFLAFVGITVLRCSGMACAQGIESYYKFRVVRLPKVAEAEKKQGPALMPPSVVAPAPKPDPNASTDTADLEKKDAKSDNIKDFVTQKELKDALKKAAWSKGDYTVVPYGIVWVSTIEETERSVPGDYALWIESAEIAGERAFYVDAKSSRFGLDVGGPSVCLFGSPAKSSGKIEFDFQGQFVDENRPGILFRQGYIAVDNGPTKFLMGQTWDVISPLWPEMVSYLVGLCAGNIGYRRAMIELDHKVDLHPRLQWLWQGSLNTNIVSNVPLDNEFVSGFPSAWPILEMRTALTTGDWRCGPYPFIFGVSGHFGEQEFDFRPYPPAGLPAAHDVVRRTWSFNVDFRIPLNEQWSIDGEFFTGEDLADFLGGILQSVDLGTRRTIRSTGGWFGVNYQWTKEVGFHSGYSIDDPFNQDITTAAGRTYNHTIWANVIYRPHKRWMLGFEVSSWKTFYHGLRPGEAMRFEAQMRLYF